MKKTVRIGIVGVGGMGGGHARYIQAGEVDRCQLAAVCDIVPEYLERFDGVERFSDSRKMIRSGCIDAVLIATPHYAHTTIGIDALQQGLHVLVEKPISVHKADCERLIRAQKKKKQIFSAMFNMRTNPVYQKARELIQNGQLGELMRVNFIITSWFRTEFYYASGGWRATWRGEGGGVLLNQCPHQLDLLQWLCGMPSKVQSLIRLGARHNIEVEDEVTALLEYPNGASGVFVTSTGEAPGTNRMEICGEQGKLLIEDGALRFTRNEIPATEFSRTVQKSFATPPVWDIRFPGVQNGGGHRDITQNFVNAILDGEPLLAPAAEGIHSVELGNAMLLAGLTGKPVSIPMNSAVFERRLKRLISGSRFEKKTSGKRSKEDMKQSFGKA